jgi:hypothetical protein
MDRPFAAKKRMLARFAQSFFSGTAFPCQQPFDHLRGAGQTVGIANLATSPLCAVRESHNSYCDINTVNALHDCIYP